MSTYYRREERDVRERDWDSRSVVSRRDDRREEDSGYVTKKVYRIPASGIDEDRRTIVAGSSLRGSDRDRDQAYTTETRVIRRIAEPEPEPEPEIERREIRITERSRERPREEPIRERVIYREREDDRLAPYRPIIREDDLRDSRGELARYSRETDYYPAPPQPIIIRQEPQQIIIQEAPRAPITVPEREEDFQMIRRSEVRESQKSTVGSDHRSERPRKDRDDDEEDYYYERRVKRIERDDYDDERRSRRERDVSPGSSISQRDSHRRRYSSDDSYDYVRKEEYGYDDDVEPRHRRHLAEAAIAGVGAAEILRHHREKETGEKGSRRGRVGRDLGGAVAGVLGAEAVSRARSAHRSRSRRASRSRDRDRDDDRDGRRRRRGERERSRSRSDSHSRAKKIAGLGLGAAAIAAGAAYLTKQNKEKNQRQSRSRHRQGSADDSVPDDARDPKHRNSKVAGAGLAGAAVAGLVEHARSKSRGGRDRSKSRIRQGIPIAAAGLGSAAIAGLYERNQAEKKEKEAKHAERAERRHRDRSASYVPGVGPDGNREVASPIAGEPNMIEYGDGQVYSGVPDYGRPASQQGYYGNHEDAIIPAAAAAGGAAAYGAHRERERSLSGSDDSHRRRRRHRRRKSGSRSRDGGQDDASAATEHEQRKAARKEEKRREKQRRREAEEASYGQQPQGYEQPYQPPAAGAGYPPPEGGYYPPPTGDPGYVEGAHVEQPTQIHPDYGYQQPANYVPPDPNAYSANPGPNPYAAGAGGPRRADENVSQEASRQPPSLDATPLYNPEGVPFYYEPHKIPPFGDGLNTPRALSPSRAPAAASASSAAPPRSSSQPPPTKSVTFNLSDSEDDDHNDKHRQHPRLYPARHDDGDDGDDTEPSPTARKQQRPGIKRQATGRPPPKPGRGQDHEPDDPADSDSTEELPDRFDKHGRRLDDSEEGGNPLQKGIEALIGGSGVGEGLAGILQGLGLGGEDRGREGRGGEGSGRRRRRRRRDSR